MPRASLIHFSLLAVLAGLGMISVFNDPGLVEQPSIFKGSFGEEFQCSSPLTIQYDPYGHADMAAFFMNGRQIGQFNLIGLPPIDDERIMKDSVTDDIKKKTGATHVTHDGFDNPNGCHFECFEASADLHGVPHRYFVFLFFNWDQLGNPAMRARFGGHRFEFLVPEADCAVAKPRLMQVVNTFKRPHKSGP